MNKSRKEGEVHCTTCKYYLNTIYHSRSLLRNTEVCRLCRRENKYDTKENK